MDSNYLQQQRFLLQKRVKRLNSCDYQLFHSLFVQFWAYLNAHAMFSGVLQRLAAEAPAYETELQQVSSGEHVIVWETEREAAFFNFRVLQYCASQPITSSPGPAVKIGRSMSSGTKFAEILDAFRESYLEPFYEHLDEALDGQAAVLSLLLKYKRHVEWFERDQVRASIDGGGERTVARHMYAYLFDQGLDFHIEPQSVSGEPDLVAPELVLDAKLFDGQARNKRYVLSGVNQVLTYARDFMQQVAYLVIYRSCPEDLQFSFARSDTLVPFLVIDGRVIYFLVIDVCKYDGPASKRGPLKAHLIDEDEVRTIVKELPPPSSSMLSQT